MDTTHGPAAILRDAREGALLRMRLVRVATIVATLPFKRQNAGGGLCLAGVSDSEPVQFAFNSKKSKRETHHESRSRLFAPRKSLPSMRPAHRGAGLD